MIINRTNTPGNVGLGVTLLLTLAFTFPVQAKLDGAIFTTTPSGDIVNENVRYESKQEVFLDGGPGPNAPRTAAALPEGLYYFQVTDPSGKCLLSSTLESADTNGGTCYEDVKLKGKSAKNAEEFYAEPLACRLFYFDGEDGVTFMNEVITVTQEVKVRGKMETQSIDIDCKHLLGSEYLDVDPTSMPDGETIQLYPFANTPNSGGVYKAWVSTASSVEEACGDNIYDVEETGENCSGFFGFIPRNSKTDNFKALTKEPPLNFDIALRAFHDKNLSCEYDQGDEVIDNWELGIRDLTQPLNMRNTTDTNKSKEEPTIISVSGNEDSPWSVDQFMWWAYEYEGVTPMNTPFSHFTTFAELKKFAPDFDDVEGDPLITFANTFACQNDDTVRRSTGEDSDKTAVSNDPTDDSGFIPSTYAEPTYDDDPVLTVRFGSIGVARLKVCKSFDANGDGVHDDGEALIPNWPVTLEIPASVPVPKPFNSDNDEFAVIEELLQEAGILPEGVNLAPVYVKEGEEYAGKGYVTKYTEVNLDEEGEPLEGHGCVDFYVLVPNVRGDDPAKYKVFEDIENLHADWSNESPAEITFDVESKLTYSTVEPTTPKLEGVVINRSDEEEGEDKGNLVYFNNVCTATANFDTKGYWHNTNGLSELVEADRDFVNNLKYEYEAGKFYDGPYMNPSDYFDAGDEPFDGDEWKSEVSLFLIDSNGNADLNDHKEQLAQQLLAFIFNTRHNLNNPEGTIMFDEEWIPVGDIIDRAVAAWLGTDIVEINDIKDLLDGINNNNEVEVLVSSPEDCPAPYPVDQ